MQEESFPKVMLIRYFVSLMMSSAGSLEYNVQSRTISSSSDNFTNDNLFRQRLIFHSDLPDYVDILETLMKVTGVTEWHWQPMLVNAPGPGELITISQLRMFSA